MRTLQAIIAVILLFVGGGATQVAAFCDGTSGRTVTMAVGEDVLSIEVASARAIKDDTNGYRIEVVLCPNGAEALAKLTAKNVGRSMEIRVGDRVLIKPIIRDAITDRKLEFSGNYTSTAADTLVKQLTEGSVH